MLLTCCAHNGVQLLPNGTTDRQFRTQVQNIIGRNVDTVRGGHWEKCCLGNTKVDNRKEDMKTGVMGNNTIDWN